MKVERNQITPTVSTRGWNKHTSPVNRCDPVTRLWYDYVSPRAAESWNQFQKCREPYETCVSYCSGVYQSVLMSWCSCDILFSCSCVLMYFIWAPLSVSNGSDLPLWVRLCLDRCSHRDKSLCTSGLLLLGKHLGVALPVAPSPEGPQRQQQEPEPRLCLFVGSWSRTDTNTQPENCLTKNTETQTAKS